MPTTSNYPLASDSLGNIHPLHVNGHPLNLPAGSTLDGGPFSDALTFSDSLVRVVNDVTLSGDSATPGNSKYYGTNGAGAKGYFTLPSGFSGAFADLTGKPTTIAGYGITDFNSLGDARWDALGAAAAVTTTSIGAVPTSRTVNGHALSSNVTVTPTDLGLVIGTNVEAWSINLDAWSALATSAKQDHSTNLDGWSALATSAKQDALGFTPENVANKAADFSVLNDTLYPTTKAVNDQLAGIKDQSANTAKTGNTIWVDSVNGVDATGVRGQQDLKFKTIAAAFSATGITSGDVVRLMAGVYDGNELVQPAGVALVGDGIGVSVISSAHGNHAILKLSSNCLVQDVSIIGTKTDGTSQYPIKNAVNDPTGVTLINVYASADSDALIWSSTDTGLTLKAFNCIFSGKLDNIQISNGTTEFYNCRSEAIGPSATGITIAAGINATGPGAVIRWYSGSIKAAGATGTNETIAATGGGRIEAYNASIHTGTSATHNYDINVPDASTVFYTNVTRDDGAALTINNVGGIVTNISRFENLYNKATDFTTVNDTLYPSVQAASAQLALKINVVGGQAFDSAGTPKLSADFAARKLYAPDGTTTLFDWTGVSRVTVASPSGVKMPTAANGMQFGNFSGAGGIYIGNDGRIYNGQQDPALPIIDLQSGLIYDDFPGLLSIDWTDRTLYAGDGSTLELNWIDPTKLQFFDGTSYITSTGVYIGAGG